MLETLRHARRSLQRRIITRFKPALLQHYFIANFSPPPPVSSVLPLAYETPLHLPTRLSIRRVRSTSPPITPRAWEKVPAAYNHTQLPFLPDIDVSFYPLVRPTSNLPYEQVYDPPGYSTQSLAFFGDAFIYEAMTTSLLTVCAQRDMTFMPDITYVRGQLISNATFSYLAYAYGLQTGPVIGKRAADRMEAYIGAAYLSAKWSGSTKRMDEFRAFLKALCSPSVWECLGDVQYGIPIQRVALASMPSVKRDMHNAAGVAVHPTPSPLAKSTSNTKPSYPISSVAQKSTRPTATAAQPSAPAIPPTAGNISQADTNISKPADVKPTAVNPLPKSKRRPTTKDEKVIPPTQNSRTIDTSAELANELPQRSASIPEVIPPNPSHQDVDTTPEIPKDTDPNIIPAKTTSPTPEQPRLPENYVEMSKTERVAVRRAFLSRHGSEAMLREMRRSNALFARINLQKLSEARDESRTPSPGNSGKGSEQSHKLDDPSVEKSHPRSESQTAQSREDIIAARNERRIVTRRNKLIAIAKKTERVKQGDKSAQKVRRDSMIGRYEDEYDAGQNDIDQYYADAFALRETNDGESVLEGGMHEQEQVGMHNADQHTASETDDESEIRDLYAEDNDPTHTEAESSGADPRFFLDAAQGLDIPRPLTEMPALEDHSAVDGDCEGTGEPYGENATETTADSVDAITQDKKQEK